MKKVKLVDVIGVYYVADIVCECILTPTVFVNHSDRLDTVSYFVSMNAGLLEPKM